MTLLRTIVDDLEAILVKFAPEVWEASPLFYIHHPTPKQRYDQALRMHDNLKELSKNWGKTSDSEPPKLEDFLDEEDDKEVKPLEELSNILGACLWDIFSNNHEVVGRKGNVYDLGSFRGSAGFIADFFNQHTPVEARYGYLDFYMGSIFVSDRADLLPVYEWTFEKLKALGCDWIYHFPRMYLISFDKPEDGEKETLDDMTSYDPARSLEQEMEKKKQKDEAAKLRADLDDAYEKAVEEAKYQPLPRVVQAYKNVYGALPEGWPHQ